jgi:hypothetical protein
VPVAGRTYGRAHRDLRARVNAIVQAGQATCWRCRNPIEPGSAWDLGHDDHDRTHYRGPEHQACNRRAGAEKRNQQAAGQRPPTVRAWW